MGAREQGQGGNKMLVYILEQGGRRNCRGCCGEVADARALLVADDPMREPSVYRRGLFLGVPSDERKGYSPFPLPASHAPAISC